MRLRIIIALLITISAPSLCASTSLDSEIKDKNEALYLASFLPNNKNLICQLIAAGAHVNNAHPDWTPLHAAAYMGRLLTVRILLENGANPKTKTNICNRTAFDLAQQQNHSGIMALLHLYEHSHRTKK